MLGKEIETFNSLYSKALYNVQLTIQSLYKNCCVQVQYTVYEQQLPSYLFVSFVMHELVSIKKKDECREVGMRISHTLIIAHSFRKSILEKFFTA